MQAIADVLRNPQQVHQHAADRPAELLARLAADAQLATDCDLVYSPHADACRQAVGAACCCSYAETWLS